MCEFAKLWLSSSYSVWPLLLQTIHKRQYIDKKQLFTTSLPVYVSMYHHPSWCKHLHFKTIVDDVDTLGNDAKSSEHINNYRFCEVTTPSLDCSVEQFPEMFLCVQIVFFLLFSLSMSINCHAEFSVFGRCEAFFLSLTRNQLSVKQLSNNFF